MIDYIYSPRTVIMAKRDYADAGNRVNAVFMSNAMHDGEAVRKLIHNKCMDGPDILRAFYRYYNEHRHKETLWNDIYEINENSQTYGECGIYAETDRFGNKIIADRNTQYGGGESDWADIDCYDKRYTGEESDYFGRGHKKYENASVAEVLADTLKHRTYLRDYSPQTPNGNLNLLLRNLYYAQYYGPKTMEDIVYYKALKLINTDLETAFAAGKKLKSKDYMPAIIFLDEKSALIFDKIDYIQQREFYRSPLGQESLKFTYLTSLGVLDLQKKQMDNFLDDVKGQTLWQAAQKRITQEFTYWGFRSSISANRWLELNVIKPQPKEKPYVPYYKTDIERAEYMNLYSVNKQRI